MSDGVPVAFDNPSNARKGDGENIERICGVLEISCGELYLTNILLLTFQAEIHYAEKRRLYLCLLDHPTFTKQCLESAVQSVDMALFHSPRVVSFIMVESFILNFGYLNW